MSVVAGPWTDAVACWLLTFAIHGALLLGTALAAGLLLGLRGLAWQELLLRAGLLLPVVTSGLQWWLLGGPLDVVPAFAAGPGPLTPAIAAAVPPPSAPAWSDVAAAAPEGALPAAASWSAWLQPGALVVLVALALAAGGAAWLLRLWLRLRRVLAARRPETDGRLRRLLAEIAAASGLRSPPRLGRCAGLASPVVFGLLQPEVCLPARAAELGNDELRALLAHEVAHVRRRDAFWLWLGAGLQALFPWQILLWPARRRLHLLAELRCDAEACRRSSPTAVAECLLEVAGWLRPMAALPALASGMAARPSALRRRVEAVLDGPRAARVPPLAALMLALAMLATATAAAPGVRVAPADSALGAQPEPAAPPARAAALPAQLDGLRRERESLLAEAAALRLEIGQRPEDPTLQRLLVLLEDQVAAMMRASTRLEAVLARLERSGPDASARRTR